VVIIAKKNKFNVNQHILVPKHTKATDKEKKELLEKYRITLKELPRISIKDPAIKDMGLAINDIIKIDRPSPTAERTVYYRRVVR